MKMRELMTLWNIKVNDDSLVRADKAISQMKVGINNLKRKTASATNAMSHSLGGMQSSISNLKLKTISATNAMSHSLDGMQSSIIGIKTNAALATLAIAGHVSSLWAFASSTAAIADSTAKTADKLGVGIETLQQLRYGAGLSGVDTNTFDTALQRFTRRVSEAKQGLGEALPALKALKIELKNDDGSGKETLNVLYDVADALQKIEDPAERVRLAFKLFDSEGVGLINLLKLGRRGVQDLQAEASKFGIVISSDVARASETFNDSTDRLLGVMGGIRNEVGGKLLPVLTQVNNKWRDYLLTNREVISTNINSFMNRGVFLLESISNAALSGITAINSIAESLGGMDKALRLAGIALGLYSTKMLLAQAATFALPALLALLQTAIAAVALAIGSLVVDDIITFIEGGKSVVGDLIEKFEELYASVENTEFVKFLKNIYNLFIAIDNLDPFDRLLESLKPVVDLLEKAYEFTSWISKSFVLPAIKYQVDTYADGANALLKGGNSVLSWATDQLNELGKNTSNQLLDFNNFQPFTPVTHPLPQLGPVRSGDTINKIELTINANDEIGGKKAAEAARTVFDEYFREWEEKKKRESKSTIEY